MPLFQNFFKSTGPERFYWSQAIRPVLNLAHCGLVNIELQVNIGSGNGLLPDDTKPLPEPMLTYHQ